MSNAIAIIHRDAIIQQVAQGVMLKRIAADLNISSAAISQYLAHDPEYIAAREHGAAARLENKYEEMEGADDMLKLARARECFKAASWFAEREFSHRWGAKQVNTNINLDATSVDKLLAEKMGRLIEHVATPQLAESGATSANNGDETR